MNEHSVPASCPECESRSCHEVIEDFEVEMPDRKILVVPQIPVWHCDRCGARWLGPAASDAVDHFVRKGGKWGNDV
jgi:YgiT-type zinc finger domain-containing protein